MKLTLLKEAWGGLLQRGAATRVSSGGMLLAMAACALVAVLALSRAAIDPSVPEPERVVMLDFMPHPPGEDPHWQLAAPAGLVPLLKTRGLPLDLLSRSSSEGFTLHMNADGQDRLEVVRVLAADPELVPLLGIKALHGDLEATLRRQDAIALTPNLVRKLWGELPLAQAIGRSVECRGKAYQVTAVMPAIDGRSSLNAAHEAMVSFELVGSDFRGGIIDSPQALQSIHQGNAQIYARLRPGATPEQLAPLLEQAYRAHPLYAKLPPEWLEKSPSKKAADFRALTLAQLPLEGQPMIWDLLSALGAASALLFMLAAINSMNLQAAQLLQRRRETALRRSLGATGADLLRLWSMETLLALLLSAAGAALLVWWLAPAVADWLGLSAERPIVDALPMPVLAGLGLAVLLLLPLTLALPAAMALRQVPAAALQGRTASEGPWGRRIRQGLLTLQLSGALLLLALTGVLSLQHRHMVHADRGIATENRLILSAIVERDFVPPMDAFAAGLRQHPAITHFAFSSARPAMDTDGPSELHIGPQGAKQMLRMTVASPSFFDTYGIKVLAGDPRSGSGDGRLVIDAKAARLLGFAAPQDAVGAVLRGGGDLATQGQEQRRVLAVVTDIKQESARDAARPQGFLLSDAPQWDLTVYGPDPVALRAALEEVWKSHGPPLAHLIWTADEQRARVYHLEQLLTWLLGAVALLAVGVAMLGAYALVADTLRRRRTELVLRRLHGAGHGDIAREVAAEFALPLALAGLIGLPLAGWLGFTYLEDFVDRIGLGAGLALPLLVAALLTLLITALAALRHLRLALALQPIEALR
ncbi:ABC transporter permease [Paucibacter sp. B2R-40]|uniref:ABC transporter permease n=1 Tax=Paucibacter sp. B2R-40 TaxID=2893554 RepID=UPI0021E48DFA|nr:FtsX-like permease family protein [Paucibacter sp. B2R-40]MCV2353521.1 ABC transporter permease [Paucibacter sp. B2R-40]